MVCAMARLLLRLRKKITMNTACTKDNKFQGWKRLLRNVLREVQSA